MGMQEVPEELGKLIEEDLRIPADGIYLARGMAIDAGYLDPVLAAQMLAEGDLPQVEEIQIPSVKTTASLRESRAKKENDTTP